MKKFIMLSALVAATSTAFVACSSEDDLAQQPKAPETTVEEGTPLKIKVVDATRGTDWSAATLPSISLYSIANGGTTRGFGTYSAGNSEGVFFKNDGSGNFASGTLSNENPPVFTAGDVSWPVEDTTWDIYALSNKDAVSTFDFTEESDADLEDLARATERNFTYTVSTNYNEQQDLLVGTALGKTKANPTVTIPFQHALAQIGEIEFTFSALASNVSDRYFLIKSATLHNIYTTGKFTFPDGEELEIDRTDANSANHKDNVTDAWTTGAATGVLATLGDYHIDFPRFQLDDNNNYLIFDEVTDLSDHEIYENAPTDFAYGTNRYQYPDPEDPTNTITVPNYFQCPAAGGTWKYRLPLAKKTGSEGTAFESYDATAATYTTDGGLYIIPQSLPKTVWDMDGTEIKGITSGVYLEIHGAIIYMSEPGETDWDDKFASDFEGATGNCQFTHFNNYYATQVLNHDAYLGKYLVPLVKAKKILKAGGRYRLTFDLSKAVTTESGAVVFAGATIND